MQCETSTLRFPFITLFSGQVNAMPLDESSRVFIRELLLNASQRPETDFDAHTHAVRYPLLSASRLALDHRPRVTLCA